MSEPIKPALSAASKSEMALVAYSHIKRLAKGDRGVIDALIRRASDERGFGGRLYRCELLTQQAEIWAQDGREIGYDASAVSTPPACRCLEPNP